MLLYKTDTPKDGNCDWVYSKEEEAHGKAVCVDRVNAAIVAAGGTIGVPGDHL